MIRKHQPISVDRWKLIVWEANWDMASMPQRIIDEAAKLRQTSGLKMDLDLLSFHEMIYPWLASYSTGDVPTVEEAFELDDASLDKWYKAVRATNPDLFPDTIPDAVKITFRDGSWFHVVSSYWPSTLRKIFHYDNLAHLYLAEHPEDINTFARKKIYAKLIGCSVGKVLPSYEDMADWPATELQLWYENVLRLNPSLFLTANEQGELLKSTKDDAEAKKNYSRAKSSATSQKLSKKKAATSRQ